MLINLDPNPTYHTSAEFPEKAVLVLFGGVDFSIKKEEVVPAFKQAVDTFLPSASATSYSTITV